MIKAIALYLFLVALLTIGAGWLTLLINGTRPRFYLGLFYTFDPANGTYRNTLFRDTAHGPQAWRWWQLLSFSYMPISSVELPSTGHRLWVYTRWGSWHFDMFLNRTVLNVEKTNA